MNLQEQFGKRIKELRLSKSLSQENLAHIANIDRTYITDVENGKRNISINNIGKIVSALEISISDFFNSKLFQNE